MAARNRKDVLDANLIGSPGFEFDEARVREHARRTWDGGHDPRGVARHLMAIQASGDRSEALRLLEVPTLVIHGAADPLIQLAGGEATAAAIPGARLEVVEGMGTRMGTTCRPSCTDSSPTASRSSLAPRRWRVWAAAPARPGAD